jgi:hypothetical protein
MRDSFGVRHKPSSLLREGFLIFSEDMPPSAAAKDWLDVVVLDQQEYEVFNANARGGEMRPRNSSFDLWIPDILRNVDMQMRIMNARTMRMPVVGDDAARILIVGENIAIFPAVGLKQAVSSRNDSERLVDLKIKPAPIPGGYRGRRFE